MNDDELIRHLQDLGKQQPAAPAYLAQRVLADLPPLNRVDRFYVWLTLWLNGPIWRGVAAAALPLALGFAVGTFSDNGTADDVALWYAAEDLLYGTPLQEYEYDEI